MHDGNPLEDHQKLEAAGLNNHARLNVIVQDVALAIGTSFDDDVPDDFRTAGATVDVWNVIGRTKVASRHEEAGDADCLAFSPDGELLAIGCSGGAVMLWDIAAGKSTCISYKLADHIVGIAFSWGSDLLVFVDSNRGLCVWHVRKTRIVLDRFVDNGIIDDMTTVAFGVRPGTVACVPYYDNTFPVHVWTLTHSPGIRMKQP